ncbi:MAG: hypothetical protein ACK5NB_07590 [Flavobacteriaceae bacterium]
MIRLKLVVAFLLLFFNCSGQNNKKPNDLDVRDQYDIKVENMEELELVIKKNINFKNAEDNCKSKFMIKFILNKDFKTVDSVMISKQRSLLISREQESRLLLELKRVVKISIGYKGKEYYSALNKEPEIGIIVNGGKYCEE